MLLVLLFPYVEPQIFKSFDVADDFFAVLKLLSACVVLILYLREKISLIVVGMVVLQLWIGLSTVVNEGSLVRFAGPAITSVVVLMIAEMALRSDLSFFLRGLRDLLTVYVIGNIVSILFIGWGLIDLPHPFLGMDNRWIYFLLPWVTLSFAVDMLDGGKVTNCSWMTLVASIAQLFLVWSVGALISVVLWGALWLCGNLTPMQRRSKLASHTGVLFVAVVLMNFMLISGVLLDWLGDFVSATLHKDVTLSGRTLIWDRVLQVLQSNPLLGEGVQPEAYDVSLFTAISPSNPAFWVNHPHNYFLNVAFHGGWVAGIIFAVICFGSVIPLHRCANSGYAHALFCGMACFFIASLVDTLDFSLFYLLMALSAYSSSMNLVSSEDDI